MKSIAVTKPNRIELVNIPEPEPEDYEVRIKTEIAFFCNATDRKIIEGHFPGIDRYPILLGHESVGIVDKIGDHVTSFNLGDRVVGGLLISPTDPKYISGWGGFSEYILAKDHKAMVDAGIADTRHGWDEIFQIMKPVTKTIPVEAAGLLSTWREVYGGIEDFQLKSSHSLLIFGAGPVGLSFVKFAKLLGMEFVACVDSHEEKRSLALKLGADEVFRSDEISVVKNTLKGKIDAVIDAVGSEEIINNGLQIIKTAGSICVYGVLGDASIKIDKQYGPYNFNVLFHQWPTRKKEAAAQKPIIDWIEQGNLDYQDFVSAEFSVDEIDRAIDFLNSRKPIKIMIRF